MRKFYPLLAAAMLIASVSIAREISGAEAQKQISGAEKIIAGDRSDLPEFVQFRKDAQPLFGNFSTFAHEVFSLSADHDFMLISADKDPLGYTHYRYRETYKGFPMEATMYIVHVLNSRIVSMNGQIFGSLDVDVTAGIHEAAALSKALAYMNAETYRWQVPAWEQRLKYQTKDQAATWFPAGELMLAPQNGKVRAAEYRLAYRFDIYAEKPLKREYVFVDASTGEIIFTRDRIHTANSIATANTAYSGLREIITDSVNVTTYRLREVNRGIGLGIETYDMQQGTNYNNTDFLDTDNYWDNVNANQDEYATDAHWGAEMTYDYYYQNFSRNSIDDAGMVLYSYVHYDIGYTNAFWDGTEMTYGDGSNPYTPLTSLEIAGHEISHGVTERTSDLIYNDESGAMNESFSDCMGNAIRWYGKGAGGIDWLIGNEIGGTPFRNMANPNQYQNPDCYNGNYYNAPNEVHNNSGVMNFWFYLLTEGGSGTNDLGDAYNVAALGISKAEQICYRMNAVYLFPSATHADARQWAIQAAIDLYGPCSPEHQATANAWYAVGVGGVFTAGVTAGFTPSATSFCSVPASVTFMNTTSNANVFLWNFGDGGTSTAMSPNHIYTAGGVYTVTLHADGGACGSDSVVMTNVIEVNLPVSPVGTGADACQGNTTTLTATGTGTLQWYASAIGGAPLGTGTTFNTPVLTNTTTFWVASEFPSPPQFNTPHTNAGSGTNYTNVTYRGLVFDVYAPCTLVSVLVYCQQAGPRTVLLKENGTTTQSATMNIPVGQSRIMLNFPLTPGTDLELGTDDGSNLFRNDGSAVFPYTLPGLLSITDNTAGASGYYYFFYDWEVQAAPCASARVPVVATVNMPTPSYSQNVVANIVTFTDQSIGNVVTYAWDFGDPASGVNNVSALANPVHVFTNVGQYTVCLTVTTDIGCVATVCQTVDITQVGVDDILSAQSIGVFPNPVSDIMHVTFTNSNSKYLLTISDVVGKIIAEKTAEQVQSLEWNLEQFAPGTYILTIQSDGERLIREIVRQ